jgi:hypothetical protein
MSDDIDQLRAELDHELSIAEGEIADPRKTQEVMLPVTTVEVKFVHEASDEAQHIVKLLSHGGIFSSGVTDNLQKLQDVVEELQEGVQRIIAEQKVCMHPKTLAEKEEALRNRKLELTRMHSLLVESSQIKDMLGTEMKHEIASAERLRRAIDAYLKGVMTIRKLLDTPPMTSEKREDIARVDDILRHATVLQSIADKIRSDVIFREQESMRLLLAKIQTGSEYFMTLEEDMLAGKEREYEHLANEELILLNDLRTLETRAKTAIADHISYLQRENIELQGEGKLWSLFMHYIEEQLKSLHHS